jgi:hypothetical protein
VAGAVSFQTLPAMPGLDRTSGRLSQCFRSSGRRHTAPAMIGSVSEKTGDHCGSTGVCPQTRRGAGVRQRAGTLACVRGRRRIDSRQLVGAFARPRDIRGHPRGKELSPGSGVPVDRQQDYLRSLSEGQLRQVSEVHTASGKHRVEETSFPGWVPAEDVAQASSLSEEDAFSLLGNWLRKG